MSEFTLKHELWRAENAVPSLGGIEFRIRIMQESESAPTDRQLEVLESFSNLPPRIMLDIEANATRYYERIEDLMGLDGLAGDGIEVNKEEIGQHFRINSLLIPELHDCDSDFVFVSADCDWEPEHAMELIIENGQVIFCGPHTAIPFGGRWAELIDLARDGRNVKLRELLDRQPLT